MCQISQTVTSQQLQGRGRIGLKGTWTWTWTQWGMWVEPHQSLGSAGFGADSGPCVPSSRSHKTPRDMQERLDATVVKPG
jgi:hypothetical protein